MLSVNSSSAVPHPKPIMSLQKGLGKVGSFGLYQQILCVLLGIMHNQGNYQLLTFGYLTRTPDFLCLGTDLQWESCTKADICTNNRVYKFDENAPYSMQNLFTEMDMTCWPDWQISFLV